MHFLELIAEQKIAEAERSGALRDLPGAGLPLDLYEDPLIPEDLRMAYRILKNAGIVPQEVTMLRDDYRERLLAKLDKPGNTPKKDR